MKFGFKFDVWIGQFGSTLTIWVRNTNNTHECSGNTYTEQNVRSRHEVPYMRVYVKIMRYLFRFCSIIDFFEKLNSNI